MKKVFFIYLLIIMFTGNVFSQTRDFGLWTGFEMQTKLGKRFELEFGLENRMENNLLQRDESFADLRLSYRTGDIAAGVGYRLTNNYEEKKNYGISHRLITQFRYRPDWKRFSFDYRIKYQSQYFNIYSSEDGKIPEIYIRNRLKVKYKIRKSDFEPSASYEYFYRLDQKGENRFERRRLTLSIEYEINKDNSIELSYIIHKIYNVTDPESDYVIGLSYKLDI